MKIEAKGLNQSIFVDPVKVLKNIEIGFFEENGVTYKLFMAGKMEVEGKIPNEFCIFLFQADDPEKKLYQLDKREAEAVIREGERRSGRTTRMVDAAIQELFNTGVVKVRDHHEGKHADRLALALVKDRLFREHEHVKWLSDREDPFTLHLVQGLSDKEQLELKNEY